MDEDFDLLDELEELGDLTLDNLRAGTAEFGELEAGNLLGQAERLANEALSQEELTAGSRDASSLIDIYTRAAGLFIEYAKTISISDQTKISEIKRKIGGILGRAEKLKEEEEESARSQINNQQASQSISSILDFLPAAPSTGKKTVDNVINSADQYQDSLASTPSILGLYNKGERNAHLHASTPGVSTQVRDMRY